MNTALQAFKIATSRETHLIGTLSYRNFIQLEQNDIGIVASD